jgi:hypothetical protein
VSEATFSTTWQSSGVVGLRSSSLPLPHIDTSICLTCSHSLSYAVMTLQLLQDAKAPAATTPVVGATTTAAGTACGKLDPESVDAPENALLYLSLRGSGVITYKCVEANKPVVLEEDADLTETLSKGWTGKVETKDGARYVSFPLLISSCGHRARGWFRTTCG